VAQHEERVVPQTVNHQSRPCGTQESHEQINSFGASEEEGYMPQDNWLAKFLVAIALNGMGLTSLNSQGSPLGREPPATWCPCSNNRRRA